MTKPPRSSPPSLTIYKIGGSLLDLPNLPHVIGQVLEQRPGKAALLVVGGGAAVDAVRVWDRVHHLGDDVAHELALEAMDLTASLVARFFPEARLVRSPRQVATAVANGALAILCAGCFIKAVDAQGSSQRLDHTWRVTSDSIGAWCAHVLEASEVVLVKSVPLPRGMTLAAAALANLVDENFPAYAVDLPAVSWVNARVAEPQIETWQTSTKVPPRGFEPLFPD